MVKTPPEFREMSRNVINFNKDWRFLKLPQEGGFRELLVHQNAFPDSDWEQVQLPHTWNAADSVSGRTGVCEGGEHYYRGLACYRKRFEMDCPGKRVFIEFGAAGITAQVYVNELLLGVHEGGYSAFRFDITGALKPGENLICVKVSNAPSDYIPPITDQGDFSKMGGLYRDVKLIVVNQVHMDLLDYGSSGVYITSRDITGERADIEMEVKLANDNAIPKELRVLAEIRDMEGQVVSVMDGGIRLKERERGRAILHGEIKNPKLWQGRENPYLYRVDVTLYDGETPADQVTEHFGIRSVSFDAEKGFYLNGKYLELRGVNYHQDSYENGWGMTDEERERDYKIMENMGCTSLRMAHYQHAPYEYALSDRMGLTVWTELGIVNKMSPEDERDPGVSKAFAENAQQQLTELIRQNYNHPSIIVWGISNELFQMSDSIFSLHTQLSALARREDGTRPTVYADNQFWGRFMELPCDLVGYNRYFGWYKDAGPAEKFGEWLDEYHEKREARPICLSEYGGGGAISQHKDNIHWESEIDPLGERHYENYQSELHEKIWAQLAARRYLWGKYIWCMFDFASDGREEGDTRGQNDKGLATRGRVLKDAYYFYKSVWNREPMVYITEKRFTERPCHVPRVKAYSNGESLELFVNGVSMGMGTPQEDNRTVFVWNDVELRSGEDNQLWVSASFSDGSVLADSAVWRGVKKADT